MALKWARVIVNMKAGSELQCIERDRRYTAFDCDRFIEGERFVKCAPVSAERWNEAIAKLGFDTFDEVVAYVRKGLLGLSVIGLSEADLDPANYDEAGRRRRDAES